MNEIGPTQLTDASVYSGPTGLADNIKSSDLRLPRVALLQSLSPLVVNEGEKYKAGMFIDTLTQDIIAAPVSFIPAYVFKNIIKWKPKNEGGGMIWKTTNPTPEQLKEAQWDGPNKPTADQYINAVSIIPGIDTPLIMSFCKTSLKTGQDLATLIQLSGCAWKFTYILESVKTTNTKGTFYVTRIRRGTLTSIEKMAEAAVLYEQVKNMSIDTDYEPIHDTTTGSSEPTEF